MNVELTMPVAVIRALVKLIDNTPSNERAAFMDHEEEKAVEKWRDEMLRAFKMK